MTDFDFDQLPSLEPLKDENKGFDFDSLPELDPLSRAKDKQQKDIAELTARKEALEGHIATVKETPVPKPTSEMTAIGWSSVQRMGGLETSLQKTQSELSNAENRDIFWDTVMFDDFKHDERTIKALKESLDNVSRNPSPNLEPDKHYHNTERLNKIAKHYENEDEQSQAYRHFTEEELFDEKTRQKRFAALGLDDMAMADQIRGLLENFKQTGLDIPVDKALATTVVNSVLDNMFKERVLKLAKVPFAYDGEGNVQGKTGFGRSVRLNRQILDGEDYVEPTWGNLIKAGFKSVFYPLAGQNQAQAEYDRQLSELAQGKDVRITQYVSVPAGGVGGGMAGVQKVVDPKTWGDKMWLDFARTHNLMDAWEGIPKDASPEDKYAAMQQAAGKELYRKQQNRENAEEIMRITGTHPIRSGFGEAWGSLGWTLQFALGGAVVGQTAMKGAQEQSDRLLTAKFNEDGSVQYEEDSFDRAFTKGLLNASVETASEFTSEVIWDAMFKALFNKLPGTDVLAKNVTKQMVKRSSGRAILRTARQMAAMGKAVHRGGVLSEYMEEVTAGFFNALFNYGMLDSEALATGSTVGGRVREFFTPENQLQTLEQVGYTTLLLGALGLPFGGAQAARGEYKVNNELRSALRHLGMDLQASEALLDRDVSTQIQATFNELGRRVKEGQKLDPVISDHLMAYYGASKDVRKNMSAQERNDYLAKRLQEKSVIDDNNARALLHKTGVKPEVTEKMNSEELQEAVLDMLGTLENGLGEETLARILEEAGIAPEAIPDNIAGKVKLAREIITSGEFRVLQIETRKFDKAMQLEARRMADTQAWAIQSEENSKATFEGDLTPLLESPLEHPAVSDDNVVVFLDPENNRYVVLNKVTGGVDMAFVPFTPDQKADAKALQEAADRQARIADVARETLKRREAIIQTAAGNLLRNGEKVTLVDNTEQAQHYLESKGIDKPVTGRVPGLTLKGENEILLIRDNISSSMLLMETLLHERFHLALDNMNISSQEFAKFVAKATGLNEKEILEDAEEIRKTYSKQGVKLDLNQAIEEAVAHKLETGQLLFEPSLWRYLGDKVLGIKSHKISNELGRVLAGLDNIQSEFNKGWEADSAPLEEQGEAEQGTQQPETEQEQPEVAPEATPEAAPEATPEAALEAKFSSKERDMLGMLSQVGLTKNDLDRAKLNKDQVAELYNTIEQWLEDGDNAPLDAILERFDLPRPEIQEKGADAQDTAPDAPVEEKTDQETQPEPETVETEQETEQEPAPEKEPDDPKPEEKETKSEPEQTKSPKESKPGKLIEFDSATPEQLKSAEENADIINDYPLSELHFDPWRFQFRHSFEGRGVSGALDGVKEYDKRQGGVLHVWRDPANNKVYVVNGHNRASKAIELGVTHHAVSFLNDVAKTDAEARTQGALINIREGNGTALDAAKLFRETKMTLEEFNSLGVPIRQTMGKRGHALAQLVESIFDKVVSGEVEESIGVEIGENLPDHNAQVQLMEFVKKQKRKLSISVVREIAQMTNIAVEKEAKKGSLEQTKLFGDDVGKNKLILETAQVRAEIARRLGRDKRLFGMVSKLTNKERLEQEGNVINAETGKAISQEAGLILNLFHILKETDLVKVIEKAAQEVANGTGVSKAVSDIMGQIEKTVLAAIGREAPGNEQQSVESDSPKQDDGRVSQVATPREDLTLDALTPEQEKAEREKIEEQKRKREEREEIERRAAAPLEGGMGDTTGTLPGMEGVSDIPLFTERKTKSEPETQKAVEPETKQPEAKPLDDFGEVLEGARKDMPKVLTDDISDADIAGQPFSKTWPRDVHEKIEDDLAAALAFVVREGIPSKPRQPYRLKRWVEKVNSMLSIVRDPSLVLKVTERMEKGESAFDTRGVLAKVKLLSQLPRDTWKRIGMVLESPDAVTMRSDEELKSAGFYKNEYGDWSYTTPDGAEVSLLAAINLYSDLYGKVYKTTPNVRVTIDGKTEVFEGVGKIGVEQVEAVQKLLGKEVVPTKGGLTAKSFEIWGYKNRGDTWYISKKGDPERRVLKEFTGEAAVPDAKAFLKNNLRDVIAAWEAVKARDNVSEEDARRKLNEARKGVDRRNGKDVTPEMFTESFGFRGVQFGNWVSQGKNAKERQGMLNQAFDALHDLADILGVPSQAISLNGSLGLAFGARGFGKFAAHFESDTLVINLTKTRGAGTLAHEWFHALDNYFSRMRGERGGFITQLPQAASTGVRAEVAGAFGDLVTALNESPMTTRAKAIDKSQSGYWSRVIERAARSFENYVISKMNDRGWSNDYLANIRSWDEWRETGKNAERYPYLLPEEEAPIIKAFDTLFETIETKRDPETGNTVMFKITGDEVAAIWPEYFEDREQEERLQALRGEREKFYSHENREITGIALDSSKATTEDFLRRVYKMGVETVQNRQADPEVVGRATNTFATEKGKLRALELVEEYASLDGQDLSQFNKRAPSVDERMLMFQLMRQHVFHLENASERFLRAEGAERNAIGQEMRALEGSLDRVITGLRVASTLAGRVLRNHQVGLDSLNMLVYRMARAEREKGSPLNEDEKREIMEKFKAYEQEHAKLTEELNQMEKQYQSERMAKEIAEREFAVAKEAIAKLGAFKEIEKDVLGSLDIPVTGIMFKITPEEDAAHLDAVKQGDMETAQRMVDEAAKAAGYSGPFWHGGGAGIKEFKVVGYDKYDPNKRRLIWLSDNQKYAKMYAGRWSAGSGETYRLYARNVKKWSTMDNEYTVQNANDVKSADPVTYDDAGNVIPLSERFNEQSDDIRYKITPDPMSLEEIQSRVSTGQLTAQEFVAKFAQEALARGYEPEEVKAYLKRVLVERGAKEKPGVKQQQPKQPSDPKKAKVPYNDKDGNPEPKKVAKYAWALSLKEYGDMHGFELEEMSKEHLYGVIDNAVNIANEIMGVEIFDREQLIRLTTGYGEVTENKRTEFDRALSKTRSMLLSLARINDMAYGNRAKKVETERLKTVALMRELAQEVLNMLDRGVATGTLADVDVETVKDVLNSRFDNMRRALKMAIQELAQAIERGTPTTRGEKREYEDPSDIKELKRIKKELQAAHDAMPAVLERKKALYLQNRVTNLKKQISALDEKIEKAKQGVFETVEKKTRPTTQEINDLTAERDGKKRELRELEANDLGQQAKRYEEAMARLQEVGQQLTEALEAGETLPHKDTEPLTEKQLELEARRRANTELRKQLRDNWALENEDAAERISLTRQVNTLLRQESRLQRLISDKDFQPRVTKDPPVNWQIIKKRNQVAALRSKYEMEARNLEYSMSGFKGKVKAHWETGDVVARMWKTWADVSAFVQTGMLTAGHPILASRAFMDATSNAWSEQRYIEFWQKIEQDPFYQAFIVNGGKAHQEVDVYQGGNAADVLVETMKDSHNKVTSVVGQGIDMSQKHFNILVSMMRFYAFKSIVAAQNLDINNKEHAIQLKQIANMVNQLGGAGTMPGKNLKKMFWSSAMMAAQIATATGGAGIIYNATLKGEAGKRHVWYEATPGAWKEALRIHAGLLAANLLMNVFQMLMAKLSGDDDPELGDWEGLQTDSTWDMMWRLYSRTFGPQKVGKTNIQINGSYPILRLMHETAKTLTDYDTETSKTRKIGGELARFASGRANPLMSDIVQLLLGRDYMGDPYGPMIFPKLFENKFAKDEKKVTWGDVGQGMVNMTINTLVPLAQRDLIETAVDVAEEFGIFGLMAAPVTMSLAMMGWAKSTYPVSHTRQRFEVEKIMRDYERIKKEGTREQQAEYRQRYGWVVRNEKGFKSHIKRMRDASKSGDEDKIRETGRDFYHYYIEKTERSGVGALW